MKFKLWFMYAIVTTTFWGVWGALIGYEEAFKTALGYSVWALTIVPPALVALKIINWKLEHDRRSILLGLTIGLFLAAPAGN